MSTPFHFSRLIVHMMVLAFSIQQVWNWVENGGYFVLFGLLFACGLGLPLPEDIPLLIAGALIAQGHMWFPLAAVAAWLGIIGGDCMLYNLGRRYGLEITRLPFVGHHVTRARIERAEKLFDRYGVWVVAVGRLFAGIRGAMVVAAGAIRFRFVTFIVADGLAALVSGGLWMWLGYKFGEHFEEIRTKIAHYEHIVLLILAPVLVIGVYVYWRWKKKQTLTDIALKRTAEGKKVQKKEGDRDDHMIPEITRSYSRSLDYLRRLVADVPDSSMTLQEGGAVNHPAWVIGHLVHSCQAIGGEMGIESWLPAEWGARFGTGSTPTPSREGYPTKAELLSALDDAQHRVLGRLAALGEAGLKQPLPDVRHRAMFPTIGDAVLHILTVHAAIHVGQITVWRRAVGLGPLGESFT